MSGELWPADFRTAAECAFGGRLDSTSYGVVNRRVEHAFKVWRRRYAMTPSQEVYAWEVLAWAVRSSAFDAGNRIAAGTVKSPWIYLRTAVVRQMEAVVNDERVHAGFKRRAELVDVTQQLRELVA